MPKPPTACWRLIELAGVQAAGERLQVAEIASRQAIPERYLEQMMTSPRGGYQLAQLLEQRDALLQAQAMYFI